MKEMTFLQGYPNAHLPSQWPFSPSLMTEPGKFSCVRKSTTAHIFTHIFYVFNPVSPSSCVFLALSWICLFGYLFRGHHAWHWAGFWDTHHDLRSRGAHRPGRKTVLPQIIPHVRRATKGTGECYQMC
uniref:Uncharacterized protein n=1 Tax=Pipistrellus kuhlii TaxID=59472 RepID=A0A7J7TW65_PIPKU|nr:hypothetical protein mPipKuh1_009285 [Pipistrellus kuhlii]